ncbi:SprT-like domain-containing protein [Aurantimicrobium minutum]|uniref:SprT-like domain-containing protein n=1 Tax=Aurantimicrobium minutum TaxID=708131 RepID=UPI00247633C8|nr:SprT-like domain-containing protein [Aurantimicrobium minutum]MDH6423597.1 putative SprT family Zn-dependent metalloprotease [Aurantimicrobium minutum]
MADLERVTKWADALIRLHLDPTIWSFGFDHARTRAGLCNFTDKRISVSRHLAAKYEDDEVHQILLHEVAHAIAGPRAGHGPTWKRIAYELGYDGKRTHDGSAANELAPWLGECPRGHQHYRFRQPTKVLSCGECGRGFNRANLITWQKREIS